MVDKRNDIVSFSKHLFFNGIVNEDGIKNLFEQYIKNSNNKKYTNLTSYLNGYFQLMKKSRKKLIGFSKYIFLKFFEMDNKNVLKLVKRIMIIYASNNRNSLKRYLLKWRERLLIHFRIHQRNLSSVSNGEVKSTFISGTSIGKHYKNTESCNEYYLKNLISSGSNNYCRSRRESDAEYKLLMSPKRNLKSTDMNQVITKSNSKLNLPMYYKNYENKRNKIVAKDNYLSPRKTSSKSSLKRNKANLDFNERVILYSNGKSKCMSRCYESPEKKNKENILNQTKRHDYLFNLHKQKDFNLKKLEENIKLENGITFKPKINCKSINKSTTNLLKHTRMDSLPKFDNSNIYNTYIQTCSPKVNKSLSQKNLVRSYETTDNNTNILTYDNLKTKESCINERMATKYNQTKESTSTIGKTTSEAFNIDSAFNSGFISNKNSLKNKKFEIKGKFMYQKRRDFLSENESITNYKTEMNQNKNIISSNRPDYLKLQKMFYNQKNMYKTQKIEITSDINSETCSNYQQTVSKETKKNKGTSLNPFSIDTCNEKEILEIANNYITTDESLENYEKELKKTNYDLGIRFNINQRISNKNENFSFKNQISKEKTINSNNSLSNLSSSNNTQRNLQENIKMAMKFYNIANN